MSQKHDNINPDWEQFEEEEKNEPKLTEVLTQTLKKWQWLILSIVCFTAIGVLLILCSPPKYTEDAQVVIKNDSEGNSSSSLDFNTLGIFNRNSNVRNEISTMSSPDITEEVVKMLNLDVSYFAPGVFHKTALYGNSLPIVATFPDLDNKSTISFKLHFDKQNSFSLSKLSTYDVQSRKWIKSKKSYTGTLGVPLKTEYGTVTINLKDGKSIKPGDEIIVNKNTLATAVNIYNQKVVITHDNEKGTVVNLSMTDENRQRADEVLAAVIAVYNENWVNEKNQAAISTSDFIAERLGVIEGELGNVDANISQFKSDNLVPDVETMAKSFVEEQQQLSKMTLDIETQLQAARNLRSRLTSVRENSILPTGGAIDNSALQMQIKDYNELIIKRNSLEQKSSERNPIVQQLDIDIAQMSSAILSSLDNTIQSLDNRLAGLRKAQGSNTGHLATSPKQAKYLLSVERQQKIKENLYLFLLQKREDNELNQAFTAYNIRVIKKPGGTGAPTSPKKAFILLGFFMIGLMVPFGYNYCILMLDTKVRSRKDIEGLSVPLLGEIPLDKEALKKSKKGKYPQLVVKSGRRDSTNEAFRVTRTNIEFTRIHKDGCNVLAFTSFNPGSGKSFITMNLAASLALKGRKVLVIDGDFRRGTTSQFIDKPSKGLSDYLAGHQNGINNLIVNYQGISDLYVLPMGKLPPNPTELIETPKFGELVQELKKEYDYIMIDCPPIEVVADAQIIDSLSDRTIFVAKAGLLDKSLLKELEKFYKEKKYKNLALILNGTAPEKTAYGYSGSYGVSE